MRKKEHAVPAAHWEPNFLCKRMPITAQQTAEDQRMPNWMLQPPHTC